MSVLNVIKKLLTVHLTMLIHQNLTNLHTNKISLLNQKNKKKTINNLYQTKKNYGPITKIYQKTDGRKR